MSLAKTMTLISRGISRKGSNVSETVLQFKHLTGKEKSVYLLVYQTAAGFDMEETNQEKPQ